MFSNIVKINSCFLNTKVKFCQWRILLVTCKPDVPKWPDHRWLNVSPTRCFEWEGWIRQGEEKSTSQRRRETSCRFNEPSSYFFFRTGFVDIYAGNARLIQFICAEIFLDWGQRSRWNEGPRFLCTRISAVGWPGETWTDRSICPRQRYGRINISLAF